VVSIALLSLWNSVFDVALPSGASKFIEKEWLVTNKTQSVLPISVYLLGWVLGPLLWGPLSEAYGRKPAMIGPFVLFTIFTLACALAPDWPSFLVFRFLCGTGTSSALTILPGIFADIYDTPISRGRAMALLMSVSLNNREIQTEPLTQ
jgi:MFS family permease